MVHKVAEQGQRKSIFYDDFRSEWDLHSMGELVWVWLILMDMLGNRSRVMRVCLEEMELEGKMLLEFCDEKELCVVNTWFTKGDKRKVTYSAGKNESEIDFVLVGREIESI